MKKLWMLLTIAVGPGIVAAIASLLTPPSGVAFNTYVNEDLKWPWRAGAYHTLTTLPHQGVHAGQWVEHDIDVDGSFPLHSASRGVVSRTGYLLATAQSTPTITPESQKS